MVETSHVSVVPVACADTPSSPLSFREDEACNFRAGFQAAARCGSRAVVSCLSSSTATASLFSQKRSLLPFLKIGDSCFNESINQPDIIKITAKGDVSSEGVSSDSLKPLDHESDKSQLDKLEVYFSKACGKRFVMFDQTGSNRRMIFHPSTIHEFSALFESPFNTKNCEGLKQLERSKDVEHLLVGPFPPNHSALFDTLLPLGWRSTVWTCGEEDIFPSLQGPNANICSMNEFSSCLSKENTEELDALLWSDDEMSSTGHSPSSLTLRDADYSLNAVESRAHGAQSYRKRKACLEAETKSTATSGISRAKYDFFNDSEGFGGPSSYCKGASTVFVPSSASEESSTGSSDNQRQHQT